MAPRVDQVAAPSAALLDKLVALEKEAFGEGGLSEWLLPVFAGYGRLYVLWVGDGVAGAAELIRDWTDRSTCFLVGFSIARDYRGRGLSKYLLGEILGRIGAEGVSRVRLTVAEENERGRTLYESFGFRFVERAGGFYGPGRDRLVLELDL